MSDKGCLGHAMFCQPNKIKNSVSNHLNIWLPPPPPPPKKGVGPFQSLPCVLLQGKCKRIERMAAIAL